MDLPTPAKNACDPAEDAQSLAEELPVPSQDARRPANGARNANQEPIELAENTRISPPYHSSAPIPPAPCKGSRLSVTGAPLVKARQSAAGLGAASVAQLSHHPPSGVATMAGPQGGITKGPPEP